MEQSQLVELIRTLSTQEKEHILQFASLSMFNQGRMRVQVGPLLDICLNHPWHDPEQKLEKKAVFSKLFHAQEFIEGKLEKVMVDAHKVIRTFLLTQNYFQEENEFHQVYDFSEIVRKRGLELRHQHLITKLQKIQDEFPWGNTDFFHRQYVLEKTIHEQACFYNQAKGDLNVPNTLQALEQNFHLNRLTLLNSFMLQQKITSLQIPESIRPLIEACQVPIKYLETSPTIKINNEIFTLLKKDCPVPSDVRTLFDLLLLHEKELYPANLPEFYSYLRNLCVLISNLFFDNEEIRVTLFELYHDNLQRGYLHCEGKIHPSVYLAVSVAAVRVNQFDWALEFIEKYKSELYGENEEQDIYRLNKAIYLFGVAKFSECLDYIPASSPLVNHLFVGKRLELKALYELKSDLFSYKLDAFKMFLNRTSQKLLSGYIRQTNVDFANLLTQITTSLPGDQKRAERVIKRIEENTQSAEWRWLLTKAKELKGKIT